jgi:PAS domain S-box-containing protein
MMPSQDMANDVTEAGLRRALRGAHIVVWELNLEAGHLSWSDNASELLGCAPENPSDFDRCIHPEDQDRHQALLRKSLTEAVPYNVEVRFIKPDGSIVWIRDTGGILIDNNQRVFSGVCVDITARKQAEAEAKVNAALFKAALENMDQGIIMFDATETVRVFNTRAANLLDIPVELLCQHPPFRLVLQHQLEKDDFTKSDDAFRQWVEAGGVKLYRDLYQRERPDGTVLEIRTVPLEGGGAVRTYTDITAHRMAEVEVRQSEERYRALVTATASIVWRASPDGQVIEAHGWEEFTGQHLEQYKGAGWLEVFHPDDRDAAAALWQAVIASGKPLTKPEYRVKRLDGEYRWASVQAVPVKNNDGSIREWIGTLTDVHAQKLAQEELRKTNQHLASALRAGRMMAWDWDFTTGTVTRSDTSLDILGLPSSPIDGFLERVHEEDRALYHSTFDVASRADGSYEVEYRFHKPDGQMVWLRETGQIAFGPDGQPIGARGLVLDISERRRLEALLRQSLKMEAIGQLTGGVAHDFNNLLTVILGNAEMLAESLPDPGFRAMAEMIREGAERGADLTRHLLAFGRRQSLKPVPLSLDDVVRDMAPLLRRTLGGQVELKTELSRSPLSALADRALLENAIINLAVNARDAMPQGGVLTITTGERVAGLGDGSLPPGQQVVFVTVSDTGTGMSPKVLARVFEPFFTTKEVGKGSGLGLPMVYGFAEQSGGHVSIESREGEGTSVTLLLLAVTSSLAEPTSEDERSVLPGGKERVLVVEDDPQVLQFVSSQLVSLGYEITAVSIGSDALEVIKRDNHIDLLFTDVVLPKGMSGIELSKQARQIRPELKILLTSGYAEQVFEHHGKPDDDIPLLHKPYRKKDLADLLRKVLKLNAT